jgi:uncharacterized membrane protein
VAVGAPLAVLMSALSAAALGTADFAGGFATRRARAVAIGASTQTIEAVALLAAITVLKPAAPSTTDLAFGVVAGLVSSIGLIALYEGLALGAMGVVAGLSGVGSVAIPVVVTAAIGASIPSAPQMAGIGLAVIASLVAVAAHPSRASRRGIFLGLLAAVGLGSYLLFINAGQGSMLWTLAASRVAAAMLLSGLAARSRQWTLDPRTLGLVLIVAPLDLIGNVLILDALQSLPVGLVAAISGTYPVATALLAWLVLRERLTSPGYLSVLLAVVGIVLIGQR